MSSRYFIAYAVILTHGTIFPVHGQSIVQSYDTGDSSINIIAEIGLQQFRLLEAFDQLNEQVKSLQKLHNASFQKMMSQHEISMRNLQDRRLDDHDIYIKNQTDINMRSLQAMDRRLQNLDIYIKNQTQNSRKVAYDVCSRSESPVKDCSDVRASGHTESGVYQVHVRHQLRQFSSVNAFCDMETTDGKWLVFQRRKDDSENFYRVWSEYAAGFGNPDGEFWLGNEMLHLLTTKRNYRLRIDLEDFEGQRRYAEYSKFVVSSSADKYRLTIGNYSGNAGDSLRYHNGMQFSTKDADHDTGLNRNCAQLRNGAWWYRDCIDSNLNGIYRRGNNTSPNYDGVVWHHWHGLRYSLKTTEMKFAPVP